jgi:hypothetical protein
LNEPRLARRLADRNPFLLVSAALVLAGGYLTAAGAGSTFKLIGLFAFIQLYELALLGGAGFVERLVARRDPAARRDVALLVALEVLFLGDLSFTNSVFPGTGTTGVEIGVAREDLVAPLIAAFLAIALGPLKLVLAGRAAKIEWPRAIFGYVVFALAIIHGGPILVVLSGESLNASGAIATLWWVVAFLPFVLTFATRSAPSTGETFGPFACSKARGMLVLGGALLVAAVAHIVSSSWALVVTFEAWHPAPLLLGLAAAWPRLVPARARDRATLGLSLGAPAVAILLAAFATPGESVFFGPLETTPFRAIAVLAALGLADAARVTGRPRLLYAAFGSLALALLGGTPLEVDGHLLAPTTTTKVVVAMGALGLTLLPVDHLTAALVGLVAAWVFRGDLANGWLGLGLVSLHQLVLAHRQGSAPWLKLRTVLPWTTGACAILALEPRIGLLDLQVAALVVAALVARHRGIGRGYQWPAGVTLLVATGERVATNAPRDRTGVGLLALSLGVVFLGAGLAYSVMRQRFAAWLERA